MVFWYDIVRIFFENRDNLVCSMPATKKWGLVRDCQRVEGSDTDPATFAACV